MDALRKSLNSDGKTSAQSSSRAKKSKKPAAGQKEMLMAIAGKGEGKPKAASKDTKRTSRQRKAG
jgi:DNA end-binding protein Ku